ncbi:MAG: radical SAM protein, partial [Acidobacteria bacterium]|nr:radical SAM protein [Acidobacteriota bacterium]
MRYRGHVIRPPSEAKSYLLQITYGCSWNKCTFCPAYLDKPFKIRPIDEIEQGTLLYKDFEAKKFILPDEKGLLKEMRAIIENIETERTIFRTNHASNYLPLEG